MQENRLENHPENRFGALAVTRTLFAAAVLAALLYAGTRGIGPVPPLGRLFDPVHGVWSIARTGVMPRAATGRIAGLRGKVEVAYDSRGVPHIFAASEIDAIRALGYVVARDRLFQLELQARAGAGTLTELVGRAGLESDEQTRSLGLPRAAESKLAALDPSSPSRALIDAYANGVNAYIDALSPDDYPVEYKLLGAKPAHWQPVNTMHLLNRMGYTLASSSPERARTRAAALVGNAAAAALFPEHTPIEEPIQPERDWTAPNEHFVDIPAPSAPDSSALVLASVLGHAENRDGTDDPESSHALASNNWAVAARRTRDGHALLAGDPHLDLTLPSIWYEAHLVVPGNLDVYGVTIPGASGMVIGFNRDVAWTFTNTGADVIDAYRETVDDTANPKHYRLDGAWRDVSARVERYRDLAGSVIHVDTVRYTHRGPLRHEHGTWLSIRWTVLEPSDELRGFNDAEHARDVKGFEDAIARSYFAPAQNMLAADRSGSIAIRSTGHFPIRPGDGSGLVLRDGSMSASDWKGFWPVSEYPQSLDPAQGFLASANQEPIAAESSHRYLGADGSYQVWRALRINQLLRADSAVTPDDMRAWQTDPGSVLAEMFAPYFVSAVAVEEARGKSTSSMQAGAKLLAAWNRRYTLDNTGAVLFEAAMHELTERTWDELEVDTARVATPTSAVLLELMSQPKNAWWDDRRTRGTVEDRDDIMGASIAAAYDSVVKKYGKPERGGWRWDRIRFENIQHLLRIGAFSARGIPVPGGTGTLTPSFGNGQHGPSWRMVVEMGSEVHGWGTLPGGESGDPASVHYMDRLSTWRKGELEPLQFPHTRAELRNVSAMLTLQPYQR